MGWQDQGRQEHGWFGHGVTDGSNADPGTDASVTGKSYDERSRAIAYGVIGALPASHRKQAELQYHYGTLNQLTEAMVAWMRGTRLDRASFASRFFGRRLDDPVVQALHAAALSAALATSQPDMRAASENVAKAIELVGVDQWPRFLVEAQARARNPETLAAVERSRQPVDTRSDAIRPVYPIETAIGIGAAGIVGGVGAALRAGGTAIVRQILPGRTNTNSTTRDASQPTTANQTPSPTLTIRQNPQEIHGLDLTRIRGHTPVEIGQQLDQTLLPRGWSKSPSKDGNGVRYIDEKGGLILINRGYPQGLSSSGGDMLHRGPYLKIQPGSIRIPLAGN